MTICFRRARWYHPTLGTFTGRDPLGFSAGDSNLYRYVGGNPMTRTDPSGMVVAEPTALLGGGFSECAFGAYDFNDPNGNWVPIPGGNPVPVPPGGIVIIDTWRCPYCGKIFYPYDLYCPEGNPKWTHHGIAHVCYPQGYAPGPGWFGSALDWLQGILDVGGTFEPTPFCDVSNTIIYAFRGRWEDAGLTIIGVIPYFGDLGKAGKYGRKILGIGDAADDVADA
ncbi:MAG: hypothetical protein JW959_07375, partial [Pirellulales bacterium]|nr:hypothetical protein [Pirellulales bacterium]